MKPLHLLIGALLIAAVAGVVVVKQVSERSPSEGTVGRQVLSGSHLADALKSGRPTMAEFGLGTCEVCKKMAPILEHAAVTYAGKANIVSVDLDEYAALGRYYQIRAMPTQVFFNPKGEEVGRHLGFLPPEEIAAELMKLGGK